MSYVPWYIIDVCVVVRVVRFAVSRALTIWPSRFCKTTTTIEERLTSTTYRNDVTKFIRNFWIPFDFHSRLYCSVTRHVRLENIIGRSEILSAECIRTFSIQGCACLVVLVKLSQTDDESLVSTTRRRIIVS